jgi:hypothetical protein
MRNVIALPPPPLIPKKKKVWGGSKRYSDWKGNPMTINKELSAAIFTAGQNAISTSVKGLGAVSNASKSIAENIHTLDPGVRITLHNHFKLYYEAFKRSLRDMENAMSLMEQKNRECKKG